MLPTKKMHSHRNNNLVELFNSGEKNLKNTSHFTILFFIFLLTFLFLQATCHSHGPYLEYIATLVCAVELKNLPY